MKSQNNLLNFVEIVEKLRGPNGCPWDKEQTHKTLKPYLIEETYEVLDAIDKEKPELLKEELGDLLLQVVLHAQLAKDNKSFDIEDVALEITKKMIRRHPHVFGNTKVKDSNEVLNNWEEIKNKEKRIQKSILETIPNNFPALYENYKISKKVAKVGFDWKRPNDVFDKINEELNEVKQAIRKKNKDHLKEELGDLLFSVANLCRVFNVNPELALNKANKKFRKRFASMETEIKKENLKIKKISFKKWNNLWERIKKNETK